MNLWRRIQEFRSDRGQVLVIVAVGMIVIIAMVGLVIDGGYAWGKQRETQNGADSAAEAGAVQLAENIAGTSPANTDADVLAAVNAAGAANNVGAPTAYYTDVYGNLLDASGVIVPDESSAAIVGGGSIPPNASGVKAVGAQTFDTFLARVIGFTQFTTTAPATAVAGYLGGTCEAEAGCILLPVTVPVTVLTCDGQNNPAPVSPPTLWDAPGNVVRIPLCKNGPGNVGWLDWTPQAGGTSELIDVILTPANPDITWPDWYYVTSTGNVNSKGVEDALRTYDGQIVQFPQFDNTCDATPTGPGVDDCPAGHVGGNGQNQWYHLAGMGSFFFCTSTDSECAGQGLDHGAYVNGNNSSDCEVGGNGATSCLAGRFTVILYEGHVDPAPGPVQGAATVGVQLIK